MITRVTRLKSRVLMRFRPKKWSSIHEWTHRLLITRYPQHPRQSPRNPSTLFLPTSNTKLSFQTDSGLCVMTIDGRGGFETPPGAPGRLPAASVPAVDPQSVNEPFLLTLASTASCSQSLTQAVPGGGGHGLSLLDGTASLPLPGVRQSGVFANVTLIAVDLLVCSSSGNGGSGSGMGSIMPRESGCGYCTTCNGWRFSTLRRRGLLALRTSLALAGAGTVCLWLAGK